MLAQHHRRWLSITSALCQCIMLIGKWLFWRQEEENITRIHVAISHSQQTRDNHLMLFQRRASIESMSASTGDGGGRNKR